MKGKYTNLMNKSRWIQGDGGPLVVLLKSIWYRWQSASGWNDSIMGGGNTLTDYNVICGLEDGVHVLNHNGADIIVLSDSEWRGQIFQSTDNQMFILQDMGMEETPLDFFHQTLLKKADKILHFIIEDDKLMLIVGADFVDSEGRELYENQEISIVPGKYELHVYYHQSAFLVHFVPS